MKKERIISALIGLTGAVNNNGKTESTDAIVKKALLADNEDQSVIDEIHQEKNRISPNCASCQNPCGNTSDYEISRFEKADESVKKWKELLLSRMLQYINEQKGRENLPDSIYKGIAYLGYDLEPESYQEVIKEIEDDQKSHTD